MPTVNDSRTFTFTEIINGGLDMAKRVRMRPVRSIVKDQSIIGIVGRDPAHLGDIQVGTLRDFNSSQPCRAAYKCGSWMDSIGSNP
jgi:hypothetical protein